MCDDLCTILMPCLYTIGLAFAILNTWTVSFILCLSFHRGFHALICFARSGRCCFSFSRDSVWRSYCCPIWWVSRMGIFPPLNVCVLTSVLTSYLQRHVRLGILNILHGSIPWRDVCCVPHRRRAMYVFRQPDLSGEVFIWNSDHFSALLATPEWAPMAAWVDGWLTCAGWWALVGTNGSLAGQLITGVVELWHPEYDVHRWLIFVIYAIWVVLAFLINVFAVKALPIINTTALFWSLTGVLLTIIVVLSVSLLDAYLDAFVAVLI